MSTVDQLVATIRERLIKTGLAPSRIAIELGLSNMAMRRLHSPSWRCKLETLRRAELWLDERDSRGDDIQIRHITPPADHHSIGDDEKGCSGQPISQLQENRHQ